MLNDQAKKAARKAFIVAGVALVGIALLYGGVRFGEAYHPSTTVPEVTAFAEKRIAHYRVPATPTQAAPVTSAKQASARTHHVKPAKADDLMKLPLRGQHVVAKGETCFSLARKNGMKLAQFYELNPYLHGSCAKLRDGDTVAIAK